jgi:hypothetical protein
METDFPPEGAGGTMTVVAVQRTYCQKIEHKCFSITAHATTYLADVDIRALLVNLRVVGDKKRYVDTRRTIDAIASVAGTNNMGSLAVVALCTYAEHLTNFKVRAFGINVVDIVHGELVAIGNSDLRKRRAKQRYGYARRHVLGGGNAITVVTFLDSVRAGTFCSHSGYKIEQKNISFYLNRSLQKRLLTLGDKGTEGDSDDLGEHVYNTRGGWRIKDSVVVKRVRKDERQTSGRSGRKQRVKD